MWGVNVTRHLEILSARNSWVMVCIVHFTNWVELIPLPSELLQDSARGIPEGVLSRYEVPREELTDQGRDVMGKL